MSTPKERLGDMQTVILSAEASGSKSFGVRIVEAREDSLVGKELHFERPILIGRGDDCDIVLPDTAASRKHARIEQSPGGFLLQDQKSANGTWVGDRRVEVQPLEHLDRFRVGTTVLEFLRDDDETGDDLELVRTTSIPVKEILDQLSQRVAAAGPETRLEDAGEPVVVSGNKPFFLDDPESMWIVESGRIDVFTVAVKDGEPAGARSYFIGAEGGQALFGMDLASFGAGNAFLAAGKSGTRLVKLPMARLQALAKEERHVARIAGMVDGWVAALARALTRDLPAGPPIDVDLEAGAPEFLTFQRKARARHGVVWVRSGRRQLLSIGLSQIDGGSALFPVTADAWIESASPDPMTVFPAAAAASLDDPSFWAGLTLFHQVLCECEFLNKRLALVDEFNRLRSKAKESEAAQEAAYAEIGAVLATDKKKVEVERGDAEPLFQAVRLVCKALGMASKKAPESKTERSFEETLMHIALASRFRTRVVALRGAWWRGDQGPLLARLEETKEPVALLPTSPSSYDLVDPKTGERRPVTPELAMTLNPFAWAFYRRFPDGAVTAKDVVVFGSRGLGRDIAMLVALGCGMGILGSFAPYFTGHVFDTAIPQADGGMLLQIAVALVVSAIASSAFHLTQSIATLRLQGRMDYSVGAALWDRLLDLPSNFFRQYSAGDLADRAGGIDAIRQLLAGAGIGAILGALSSLFYVGLMLSYSTTLGLVGVALTLFYVGVTTGANLLQLRFQRRQLDMRGKIAGLVLQLISGVAKLRVSGAEHHGFRVWAKEFAEQRRVAFTAGKIQSAAMVFGSAFPIFSSIAIFAVLASAQGKGPAPGLTTGEFIAFSSAYGLFLAAVQTLAESSLSLLRAVPIWERLTPILTTPPEVDETKTAPPPLKGAIELSHIWFRYGEDAPYILQDVSITIPAGGYVALVGSSGSGKSTLMRLMLGFEKPEKGTVAYDGMDLDSLDLRLVRQQIGVVLQDSRLLPADIYRNIVGSSSRTVDDAWEAATMAGLQEDIAALPMGMHTYVPEGGGGFSGGQKQRLMIARAVVNKPKILFLDEATSALDNKTQAVVTESMDRLRSTRIVIAHRLSTIVNAERIYYLEKGILAEHGTYDELMKKNGLFAQLARRQMA